jgi:hypothetical protein
MIAILAAEAEAIADRGRRATYAIISTNYLVKENREC